MSNMQNTILLIVGPSGSGKTFLMDTLIKGSPELFAPVVSFTTRAQRPGEVEGREYNFITRQEAEQIENTDEYVEMVEYDGAFRGVTKTSLAAALSTGKVIVNIVEPSGVLAYRTLTQNEGMELLTVFCVVSDVVILGRLIHRWVRAVNESGEPEIEGLNRILLAVREEMNWINQGSYHFYFDAEQHGWSNMIYALERIAKGGVSRDMIPRLAPRSF